MKFKVVSFFVRQLLAEFASAVSPCLTGLATEATYYVVVLLLKPVLHSNIARIGNVDIFGFWFSGETILKC